MNIKNLKYNIPIALIGTGIISLGIVAECNRPKNTTKEDIQNAKNIVRKHNPDKYIQTLENSDCLKGWQKAAKEVQDSLRLDSLCQKSYFESSQRINDSIKHIIKKRLP